jgi:2-keto-3-deoxy-galactonokinase
MFRDTVADNEAIAAASDAQRRHQEAEAKAHRAWLRDIDEESPASGKALMEARTEATIAARHAAELMKLTGLPRP